MFLMYALPHTKQKIKSKPMLNFKRFNQLSSIIKFLLLKIFISKKKLPIDFKIKKIVKFIHEPICQGQTKLKKFAIL